MTPGDQYPSLSHIERELGDIPPVSLPWWIRCHDLLACVACICIAGFTFYAIGALK